MMNPKIRFKKSDGSDYQDWNKKRLGDFLKIPVKEECTVSSTDDLLTVKLNCGGVFASSEKALDFGSTKYYKRHAGQFIYGKQNFHHGSMAIIPESLDGKCSSGDVPTMDIVNIDKDYLLKYVSRESYYVPKEVFANGTGSKRIHESTLQEFNINAPIDKEEQIKIANFLSEIDNLIASAEHEVKSTKQLKKAMLQKMFPKKGENVPEIRFPGFTDAWEQRKLGDIAPLRGGFAFKSSEYGTEGVPIIRISNILSDGTVGAEFAYYDEQEGDEIYSLYDGAAVLAMSGATTGKVSVLHAEKEHKYYQNQRVGYFTPTENCDYRFIRTVVQSQFFIDQLKSVLVAGAQPNVSSKEIDAFDFMIPKSSEEQYRIGEYIEKLDNLITLHQRKVDTYKKFKKSMMQKIFL